MAPTAGPLNCIKQFTKPLNNLNTGFVLLTHTMKNVTNILLTLLSGFYLSLGACKPSYTLTGTRRGEYPINNSLPADSAVVKTYLPYKQQMDAQMNEVLGRTDNELTKASDGLPESTLGNFFSDAVLSESRKLDPSIDFAMPTTKGGLRNSLPKGNLTLANLFELMPFENELIVFKLKGTDVAQLCGFIATTNGQPVSGLKLNVKNKQYSNAVINGQPLDISKDYRVLTSDYVAHGGDNCQAFMHPIEEKPLNLKVRTALINAVKATTAASKTINAQLDGRITNN